MSPTTTLPTKKIECFSMTGYAQARAERDGWAVRISVKSVNHRFLDLKLRMPEGFDLYDLRLRQIVREKIHRGHVEVTVGVEPGKAAPIQVNRELVQAYLKAAEALRQETRAATDMDVVALLRLLGVITGGTTAVPETEEEQERLGCLLDGGLREALAKLDDMRRAEGRHLGGERTEEHTSEPQSQSKLVCRLLLEKKKKKNDKHVTTPIKHSILRQT